MDEIACNICGQEKTKLLLRGKDRLHKTTDEYFNVVKCKNCGLVYLNPQPSQEELQKYYPKEYGPYQEIGMFKYGPISNFLEKIIFIFKSGKKDFATQGQRQKKDTNLNYLDFGCGGGSHLEEVRKIHPGWDLYGLDNNEYACAKTEQKGFKVFCGDISGIKLPNNFFDIVHMSHVIEHVNDPKKVLIGINGALKNNGRVEIATPNARSLSAWLFRSYWYSLDTPRHLFLFTPRTISILLTDAGFEVEKIEYTPFPKAFIKSIYFLIGKRDMRMNPIFWRFSSIGSRALARFGLTSSMVIFARKVRSF